mgnify:CR=1 FL=1
MEARQGGGGGISLVGGGGCGWLGVCVCGGGGPDHRVGWVWAWGGCIMWFGSCVRSLGAVRVRQHPLVSTCTGYIRGLGGGVAEIYYRVCGDVCGPGWVIDVGV